MSDINLADDMANSLILPILKDLIMDSINAISKKTGKKIEGNSTISSFENYLSKRYEKFLTIDTLVFPNKQTAIKVLYEPLTVVTDINHEEIQITIDTFPKDFLSKFFRVVIEDTAGMGKSTISKMLFLFIIETGAGIPILIELRHLSEKNNIISEIKNQLANLGHQFSDEFLIQFIEEGKFVFIFDGFDEIPKAEKEFVIRDLHHFIEKANNNYFLITSRPAGSLASFGDFQKFRVRPLEKWEAFELIKRYDFYSYKKIADELIKRLIEIKDQSLDTFLRNPFLVSLLYKSFDFKKDIPLKKTQFYRQVYDALFEAHDLSKEGYYKRDKYSKLHLDDFDRILRYIGFLTCIANQVEYGKDEIIAIISDAQGANFDLNFNPSDYLRDLLETVPLFQQEGNAIKWAHKSIQDYFAAKFIWLDAGQDQESILRKIYIDKQGVRFANMLDLFYELTPRTFENTILLWLLEEFDHYSNSVFEKFPAIDKKLVIERCERCFLGEHCFIVVRSKDEYYFTGDDHYESTSDEIEFEYLNPTWDVLAQSNLNIVPFDHLSTYDLTIKGPNNSIIVVSTRGVNVKKDYLFKILKDRLPLLIKLNYLDEVSLEFDPKDFLEEGKPYLVDNMESNPINSPAIFELTTNCIWEEITLNYNEVQDKLTSLRSKNSEVVNKFLDW